MLISFMTKLIILLFMINLNLFSIFGNNWRNKRYFNKKNIPRTRLESLKSRRWFRKLCRFYKIFNERFPSCLFNLIPNFNKDHNTRISYTIPPIKVRHGYFKNSCFPSTIKEWNKLDFNIRNSASFNTF